MNDLKPTGSVTGTELAETYTHTAGDGTYTLTDFDIYGTSGTDVLRFTDTLPQDVNASRTGNTLTLALLNGEVITVPNQFDTDLDYGLERIDFSDGTQWDRTEILAATVPGDGDFTEITGSAGADYIVGTDGPDRILGLEGDDFVTGGLGDDRYVFRAGDGIDSYRDMGDGTDIVEIEGYASEDAIYSRGGRSGTDLVISFGNDDDQITLINALVVGVADRIEQVRFADSGVTFAVTQIEGDLLFGRADDDDNLIVGTSAANQLQGFLGEDVMVGAGGNDTYIYAAGDGDDIISDNARDSADRLELTDLNVGDVDYVSAAGEDGNDLVIRFVTGRDRITITDGLRGSSYGVETIAFADGTEWSLADARERVIADASSDRDDVIRGFASDDTLDGGIGDDAMFGAGGNDIYLVAAGDGIDQIEDTGNTTGDRLELSGLISSEASVARLYKGSDTIVLRFATTDDEITLVNFLNEGAVGVDEIVFGDAVTWGRSEVLDALDNRAPVAERDGIVSVKQEETLLLSPADLLRNDYDADGDPLSIIAVDGGNNGVAEIGGDGNIRFTPTTGFFGPTQITYTVSDGRNGISEGIVDVRVTPLAFARDDDGFEVAEDSFLTIENIRLLSNDLDGDRMIISQVFNAQNGSASLQSNGQISFIPTPNFNGLAQFSYAANTPEGGRAEAVVYVNVTAVNDDPTARNDSGFSTLEDQGFLIDPDDLLVNDLDIDGDNLTISSVAGSLDLQVSLTDDGLIQVEPSSFFFGNASFSYTIEDPFGATDTATVSVFVVAVNNTPEPQADTLTVVEDNILLTGAADLTANDIERDGDNLTIISVGQVFGGRATLFENQTIEFRPDANFFGTAGYTYTVDDGQGGQATASVTIDVTAVNDRPVARTDSYTIEGLEYLRGDEDVAIEIPLADLLLNDFDIEGSAISIETISAPINGDIELTEFGTVIFTPDPDYWGPASFNYVISDDEGLVDGTTVNLYFDNVGDAPPEAVDDEVVVFEDIPKVISVADLLANDTDIDRDTLTLVSIRPPGRFEPDLNGTIEFNADGDILFTPDLNADESFGFYYTVSDNADGFDEGFVDIVMIPVNDDPVAGADDAGATPLDVPLVVRISDIMLNDMDIEDNDVFFNRVSATSEGTAEIYNDEFIVVRFDSGFNGPVDLTYVINDPEGLEDEGFITAAVEDSYDARLIGGSRRDLLIGNALAETIEGREDDDDIFSLGGNDTIFGGQGDDLIDSGDGDDSIDAGVGDDSILAGAGDDHIQAGDGFDDIDGGAGFDTVDLTGSNVGVRADLGARIGQGGFAQGDIYTRVEGLIGTRFADTLGGDETANHLAGGERDDTLLGRGGDDTLLGELGDDLFEGGAGADTIDGGLGSDTADYFLSDDAVVISLAAGSASGGDATGDTLISIENLIGSDFADNLIGDDNANYLRGRRGDDTILAGAGDDVLIGGRGADNLEGGAGTDIADYTLSLDGVTINLVDASAGGGDAEGDTFSGIEIIRGSFHDDTMIGDDQDNIFRGGRGADSLDGAGGFDAADYTEADEGVAVDLTTGLGTAGEALGDQLSGIEMLIGSVYQDTFTGSAGSDTFDGGFQDDLLAGAEGSDTYLFGFDSGNDIVTELGLATDIDRVVMFAPILRKDLSVLRGEGSAGNDLFLELERDDGFLIDTMTVKDHFLGTETGIEEIVFSDGLVWDRATIEDMIRTGRFNAEDDVVAFALEDVVKVIDPADLLENDATEGVEDLRIISVQNGINGTANLVTVAGVDGAEDTVQIEFLGEQDYNGNAFFEYTAEDPFGRQSTAEVRVFLDPVNDAPVAGNDGIFEGTEDEILQIAIDDLLINDFDVDGDSLTIIRLEPLYDLDGNALYTSPRFNLTNGKASVGSEFISFEPRTDHSGFAGFTYTVSDGNGGTARAEVELFFNGVNDAPRGTDDDKTVRLTQTATFTIAELLDNDTDPEDDAILFQGLHSEYGGTLEFNELTGVISFTPDALGDSGFQYDVTDTLGAPATFDVTVTAIPLNDPPRANNDFGFETLEDQVLIIDPADLLANDSDPNGDLISVTGFERFPQNGKVDFTEDGMIRFRPREDYNGPAGFIYEIADEEGLTDTARVFIDIIPSNDGPVLFNDITEGFEDQPMTFLAAEAFGNDYDPEGDVLFFETTSVLGILREDFTNRTEEKTVFEVTADRLDPAVTAVATLADGSPLPAWLLFDPATLSVSGDMPVDQVDPLEVEITLTLPGTPALTETGQITLIPADAAALVDGITLDLDVAIFDASNGTFDARLFNYRPLPEWLAFDADTMEFSFTDIAPEPDADLARVRVVYTPEPEIYDNNVFASSDDSFELEFVIDPAVGLDPAVNALLQTPDFYAAQGLFAVPLGAAQSVSALKENLADLPEWMSFDEEALSFTGTPPELYVGAVPIRMDVTGAADGSLPDFSLISDVVIDDTFSITTAGSFSNQIDQGERIFLNRPEDFNGAYAITYTARDEKDASSDAPAIVVVNVIAQPEAPDAFDDEFEGVEDEILIIQLADLLANDVDDDGDVFHAIGIDLPTIGTMDVSVAEVTVPVPAALPMLAGGVYSAMLGDGSPLPTWMVLDAATGEITAQVPFDILQTLDITVTIDDGTVTDSATVSQLFDGNAGVTLTYTPFDGYSGPVDFTYEITDDLHGNDVGNVRINLAPVNDPPEAEDDVFETLEATPLVLDFADVTANDTDVDGDTLTVTDVLNPTDGTVEILGGQIIFTPRDDWDGIAGFDYVVSDGSDGSDVAHVEVEVISTNSAPTPGLDQFDGLEDTPFTITRAELLANDTDPQNADADPDNDDVVSFVRMGDANEGVRFFNLPNGDIQILTDLNFNGLATLTYFVTDGRLEAEGNIEVNFAPVNDAPEVFGESGYIIDEDTLLTIDLADLLLNDTDVEGDAIFVSRVFDGDNGTVDMVGGQAVFTPRADYFGNAGFFYGVEDSNGAESVGFVALTVLPLDDLPIAVADIGFAVDEDQVLVLDPADLLANDYDPDGGPVTFAGFAPTALLTDLGNGLFEFNAGADANGSFTLTYAITDDSGIPVNGTVRIDVAPVADVPIALDDTFFGTEDEPLTLLTSLLTANDTDVDGEALIIREVSNFDGVTVTFDGIGGLLVTPDADRFGVVSFDYLVEDSAGDTATASVKVNLAGVNDAPVLGTVPDMTGTEDTFFTATIDRALISDIDTVALLFRARLADGSDLPDWLAFNADTLTFSGLPPQDFNGVLDLEFAVFDGDTEVAQAFTLSIAAVNDAPVAVDDTFNGGAEEIITIPLSTLLANDIDVDGDALTIVGVSGGAGFTASLDGSGNVVVVRDPALGGQISLGYLLTDGDLVADGQVLIDLDVINRAPEIGALADLRVDEDTAISFTLPADLVSDPDGDAVEVTITRAAGAALPDWLTYDPGTATLSGTPPEDFNGTIALEISATDTRATTTAEFALIVDPVNDAPRISAPFSDRFANEDQPFDIALQTGLVTDPEGDPLSYEITLQDGSALPAWIAFDPMAFALAGQPPANFNGELDLAIAISDGALTISDVFRLTVNPVNDVPELLAPLADVSTDAAGNQLATGLPFSIVVPTDQFVDPDGDELAFAARLADGTALPDWLIFDGATFTGTAPRADAGVYEVELRATDGVEEIADVFAITFAERNSPVDAQDDGVFFVTIPEVLDIDFADLLANDSDFDGDPLEIVGVSAGASGAAQLNDGFVSYIPELDFEGTDQFFYTVSDGFELSTAAVDVEVDNPFQEAIVGGTGNDNAFGGGGDDLIVGGEGNDLSFGGSGNDYIDGGTGNDNSFGGSGSDTINAGDGNDNSFGGSGGDTINSGEGDDLSFGGGGSDTITGDAGEDLLFGGGAGDSIGGGAGQDLIFGGSGRDVLSGGDGDDLIFGGGGGDTLSGGLGNDRLYGGGGSDVFYYAEGDGSDDVRGFQISRSGRRSFIPGDEVRMDVDGIDSYDDLVAFASETNGGVLFDFGDGDELFLANTRLAALDRDQFTFY